MVEDKVSGKIAVDDYFSSLLLDTQVSQPADDEPALRFARVEPGYEVMAFWQGPLNPAQSLTNDLILLSCLKKITGPMLKNAFLAAIKHVNKAL